MKRNLYTTPPLKEYFDIKTVAMAAMELAILGLTIIVGPILGFLIYGSLDAAVSVFVLGILLFFSSMLAGFVPFIGPFLYWFAAKGWVVPYVGLPPSLLIDLIVVLNLLLSITICIKATLRAIVFLGIQLGWLRAKS